MDISWLTIRDLQYVTAVAEYRHFGKAAQACHVSQPALSAQIRKIEEVLGLPLFERTNRSVMITDAGAAIAEQAKVVLEEAEKLVALAAPAKQALSGTFRLGAIATLGPFLMPHLLGPLRTTFPELRLLMKEGLTHNLVQDLKNGTLDAALVSPTFQDESLKLIPLFFEPFWVAAPKSHPILKREHISGRDLRPNQMVLLEDGHCLRGQTLSICPPNRRGASQDFHATSVETLRHLVSSGFGYTILPELAVNNDARLRKWIGYKKINNDVGREVVLACRKRSPRMHDIEALVNFIRNNLPSGLSQAV
jgi:LysR family hydrogen peroxide-inducible transcriptional activator